MLARDANTISTFAFPVPQALHTQERLGVQMTGFAVHRGSKYLLVEAASRDTSK
jgi:hypothetical protein